MKGIKFEIKDFSNFHVLHALVENRDWRLSVNSSRTLDCVIPAWSAGIQIDMDVSARILRT